jgi:hypothetical protein
MWKINMIRMSILLGFIPIIQAQEVITASGGDASGSGGTSGYSIGQLVYTTHTGTTGSVAQGIQQSYSIEDIPITALTSPIALQCLVYPNPATNFLTLKIEGSIKTQFIASLYDLNGKLLEHKPIESNETTIDMGSLFPSTYFLKITEGDKVIKIIKITKN